MSKNILHRILETKREDVARLYETTTEKALKAQMAEAPPVKDFFRAMTIPPSRKVNLIAEIKKASPSAGVIRENFDPVAIAQAYQAGGASCLSVLTDELYFQGSLEYLRAVRGVVDIPLLRKDFIIDPWQIYQARAAGADAVLLIVGALESMQLNMLMDVTASLKMTALLEVHTAEELSRLQELWVDWPKGYRYLLGVNNRNLATFTVDLATTIELAKQAGPKVPLISESGIKTLEDVIRLKEQAGVCGILVGETLMRHDDLGEAIEKLLGPSSQGASR